VYYLARRVASASELYGSLGVAAAILVWLYLIGRLVVAAAMLNATRPPCSRCRLWERRSGGVTGVTEPE
jgi:membrane protein